MIDVFSQGNQTALNIHPLIIGLLDEQAKMSKKLESLKKKKVIKEASLDTIRKSSHFSATDRFNLKSYTTLQEVLFKIDRIQQCAYMLDFYPEDFQEAWNTPIKRGEYLEQIMELYIMHSLGLIDRVLIMYDFLFDLNLSRRNRTMENIIRRLSKNDGLPLFAFCQVFREIKKSRNLITHEYRYIDNDLITLILEDTFARDKYISNSEKAKKDFNRLTKKYDKKMKELFNNIARNDKVLTEYFMPVMEVFERQYNKRIVVLEK